MFEEAKLLRRKMLAHTVALVESGLLDADRVEAAGKGHGSQAVGLALMTPAALFRESWERLANKTAIDARDVDRAAELGMGLVRAAAARDAELVDEAARVELKARVFTLLASKYGEIQRAIDYVRFGRGDAQQIAPSLCAGARTRRRPSGPALENGPATMPPNGAPVPAPAAPTPANG